ncbi:MAG: efflux RND transporter periplasmic adaptor subunit [Geminicoccaceae bacterium]
MGLQHLDASVGPSPGRYRLAVVDRGDVVSSVRASGNLSPERQLLVGAAVPGTVTAVLVSDNQKVNANQILAEMDASQQRSRLDLARTDLEVAHRAVDIAASQRDRARTMVENADATLAAAQADLAHAREVAADAARDMNRLSALARTGDAAKVETLKAASAHDEALAGVIAAEARVREAQASAEIARSDVAVAQAQMLNVAAQLASHEAAVHDAELQVNEMTMRAPMDGTILDHSVVVGQNVGVAPLFTVASDPHRLVLHANVDEADIGRIQRGQTASFSVDTYPGENFPAVVTLVKHSPQVSQNVVTYDVELAVDDPAGRLLPGMTATVSIATGKDASALRVPTSALRFKPPGMAGGGPPAVWTAGRDGEPVRHTVQPGQSDEVYTSVTAGNLSAGDAVIVGTVSRPNARSRDKSIFGF